MYRYSVCELSPSKWIMSKREIERSPKISDYKRIKAEHTRPLEPLLPIRKVTPVKLLPLTSKENIVMSDTCTCLSSATDTTKVRRSLDGDFLKKVSGEVEVHIYRSACSLFYFSEENCFWS